MDDEDFIVVDDDAPTMATPRAGPSHEPQPPPTGIRSSLRKRTALPSYAELDDPTYVDTQSSRRTRYSGLRNQPAPKLKLKLSEKAAAQAPGMSFLGPFDRELDSDDEDLVFEEQFILRMPPGEDCDKLRKMVASREISNDVWFKFKDSRRAVFHIGNQLYSAKLVDLPCIIESQKTLDNKQMFKVADICQMLVVEDPIQNEDVFSHQKNFNIDDFIWPHGITPPLHQVRKRRFRKRINRRTIETVEQEVERLLEEDEIAEKVQYEVLENVNPDLSDSEFIDRIEATDPTTPGFGGSEAGDMATPGGDRGMGDDDGEEGGDDDEGDGDIDEDLAAELDLALGDEDEGVEGDEDEDDDDESDEDDEDDDDDEAVQAKKLLNEEIRDLEAAVAKKNHEIASSANPLIRRRFEDALRKLQADLDTKLAQRDEMKEKRRWEQEGGGSASASERGDGEDRDSDDGDLFGEGPNNAMDVD